MIIGLFGGSFDPIHYGHLSIIDGALRSGFVDAVVVIPSVRNSFKRGKILSAAPYRYYMVKDTLEQQFKGKPVYISDIEFGIPGISYTVSTIDELIHGGLEKLLVDNGIKAKKASEHHDLRWLCGSDILPTFDHWYKPEEIITRAPLLVAKRPGENVDIDYEQERLSREFGFIARIESFDIKGVEASSSDIRSTKEYDRIPDVALEFIKTHNLYPANNPLDNVSDEAAEQFYQIAADLYPYLGQHRLLHTINVALLACEYANVHGANPDKALIAGILHDCAKELPIEQQLQMSRQRSGDTFVDKKLLHSPAGAIMARETFGINDEEILNAITYHTTGRGGMTVLDKIVYLADKLEPARIYTDLTEMRTLAWTDLDGAVRLCLGSVRGKFKSQGRDIHPLTLEFLQDLGI